MDIFSWIKDYQNNDKSYLSINDLLPNLFDRYALIPKSIGIIDDFPFADYPENKDSLENLNKQHAIEHRYGIFLNDNAEEKYREITLKELSDRFNVDYCVNAASYITQTPGIAILSEATKRKIEFLLNKLQRGENLRLYIKDNFRFEAGIKDWRFKQENALEHISEYIEFQELSVWDSVSYLFTDSLSWCLCTLEDYEHFILGTTESLFNSLLFINKVEMFEIKYDEHLNEKRVI